MAKNNSLRAAGFRSALTSEKGGKVQLFHNELFSLPFRSAKAEWCLKLTSMGTEVAFSDRSALAERKGQYDCCRISKEVCCHESTCLF